MIEVKNCNINATFSADDKELKEEVKKLREETEIVQLALAEIIGATSNSAIEMQVIYSEYSAISQMFANMIEKGIYTIDQVPKAFRKEVEAVLEANKKNK